MRLANSSYRRPHNIGGAYGRKIFYLLTFLFVNCTIQIWKIFLIYKDGRWPASMKPLVKGL